jgi:hypothetical protein
MAHRQEGEEPLGLAPRHFSDLFSPLLCVNSLIYNIFSIFNIIAKIQPARYQAEIESYLLKGVTFIVSNEISHSTPSDIL